MGRSIKRRLIAGVAAGALLLSIAVGFTDSASAQSIPAPAHKNNSISWCRSC